MKTLNTLTVLSATVLSALAAGIAAPAFAQEALPPTYVVHKLTADGVQLRALEAEDGIYEAKVLTTDGRIVKVGVDPRTGDLTDAYSHARTRAAKSPEPAVNASQAIMAAAATGYWDVREVDYEHGRWEIEALNDQGRERTVTVDGITGAVGWD